MSPRSRRADDGRRHRSPRAFAGARRVRPFEIRDRGPLRRRAVAGRSSGSVPRAARARKSGATRRGCARLSAPVEGCRRDRRRRNTAARGNTSAGRRRGGRAMALKRESARISRSAATCPRAGAALSGLRDDRAGARRRAPREPETRRRGRGRAAREPLRSGGRRRHARRQGLARSCCSRRLADDLPAPRRGRFGQRAPGLAAALEAGGRDRFGSLPWCRRRR
mmetsp:Transcript_9098/g.28359  ORF Transcript_9098/g.28359 Transcript_9098/m.28359 type:complete len:223 (+) Transcript_9098:1620-2288(+)